MSSDSRLTPIPEPKTGSPEERFRRDRRKLFSDALVGIPVILTITSKPLWAAAADNRSNQTGCRYILNEDLRKSLKCK